MQLYHGSTKFFKEFDYHKIRTHGTSEGPGFYFTDKKPIAETYAYPDGYIYTVDFNGKKSLNPIYPEITVSELETYLKVLHQFNGFLTNYGDPDHEGLSKVLRKAAQSERQSCPNDADLLGSIYNGSGQDPMVLILFDKILGYDHIKTTPEWGVGQTIYVALTTSVFSIVDVEKT